MSDEQPPVPVPRKSSFLSILIWVGVVGLVAAIAAVLLYTFVLKPMLSEVNEPQLAAEELGDKLNPDTITVDFEESVASVKMPEDSQLPAALLSFAVSLECNNQLTADLVQRHKARFIDMISRQHEFRTRAELDDPRVKAAIQKTILMEANTILKQLQPGPIDPSIQITDVFHRRFLVTDQL